MEQEHPQSHIPVDAAERPRPQVDPVHMGTQQRVIQGSSDRPAFMPEHYATHEAAAIVAEGTADIHYSESGTNVSVSAGQRHLIEPNQRHALSSPGASRMYLAMPAPGELRFDVA